MDREFIPSIIYARSARAKNAVVLYDRSWG